jgi:hypothetical protein
LYRQDKRLDFISMFYIEIEKSFRLLYLSMHNNNNNNDDFKFQTDFNRFYVSFTMLLHDFVYIEGRNNNDENVVDNDNDNDDDEAIYSFTWDENHPNQLLNFIGNDRIALLRELISEIRVIFYLFIDLNLILID